jgi:hypothetical protein
VGSPPARTDFFNDDRDAEQGALHR